MADLRVLPKSGLADYQAATDKVSGELREALLRATAKAGLDEKDPIHAVLVAQAELSNEGFQAHAALLTSTLEAAFSPRSAQMRKLGLSLEETGASVKQASKVVGGVAAESTAQLESLRQEVGALKAFIVSVQQSEKVARDQQAERTRADAAAVRQAAEGLEKWQFNNLAWTILIVMVATSVATLFFLRWYWGIQ